MGPEVLSNFKLLLKKGRSKSARPGAGCEGEEVQYAEADGWIWTGADDGMNWTEAGGKNCPHLRCSFHRPALSPPTPR